MATKPNPGSAEAIEQGCICPVMDNNNGAGIIMDGEQVFWYTEGCPVHHNNGEKHTNGKDS